jgi:hypothetical protein
MSKQKNNPSINFIPNIIRPPRSILKSDEELEYGLRGVVRKKSKKWVFF